MLKYLRIAVTALSLTACVLLIALWVRSYWWWDGVVYVHGDSDYTFESNLGGLKVWYRRNLPFPDDSSFDSGPTDRRWRFHLDFDLSYEHPDYYFVCFPHWVLVLLFAMFAAAPWIHWSKRFSLRTLLIATTLVAVGLGVIVLLN